MLLMEEDLLYLIALSKVPLVGIKTTKQLIAYCGSAKNVLNAKKSTLLKIPFIGPKIMDALTENEVLTAASKDLNYLTKHGIRVTTYLDRDYPVRLKHHDDSPVILYVKGESTLDAKRTVGIVGTRQPTPYGRSFTNDLVSQLKNYDVQIISGLAYGVDTLAHQQCLAEGIDTLAIMGTGIDSVYPASNRSLAQNISEHGALVSEFALNTKADRENFPLRNRIIAALSDVVVVIQSAVKGGSLITVEYANEYNKDVFALPGRISDNMSAGCNKMIKINKAHLLESAADIAYIMRWDSDGTNAGKQQMLFADLSESETLIVNCLKEQEDATSDWLHYQTKMPLSELAGTLLSLEFKGIVTSLPGKKYCLT
jgi:DNA processing protein